MANAEVVTATVLLAECKRNEFKIYSGEINESKKWAWFTEIHVPVENYNCLPFSITSAELNKIPGYIKLMIAKKINEPTLIMQVSNFGWLSSVLSRCLLFAKVHASFSCYQFHCKQEFIKVTGSEPTDDAELKITDKFLQQFDPKIGFGFHTGDFSVEVCWKLCCTKWMNNFLEQLSLLSSEEVQNQEAIVKLYAKNGKFVKVPRGLFSLHTSKYESYFQREDGNIITIYLDDDNKISEQGLLAFLDFLWSFSLKKALESCSVSLELLMAANCNNVLEMKILMQNLLLVQSVEWFNPDTTFRLYIYACKTINYCESFNKDLDTSWEHLRAKALRNMKGLEPSILSTFINSTDFESLHGIQAKCLESLIRLA